MPTCRITPVRSLWLADQGVPRAGRSTSALPAGKISSWYSLSDYAREFVAEKSLAVSEYGRVLMSKWAPGTAWTKVRSKWIRSSRSVFRISRQSWLANRVSLVSSICSRLRKEVHHIMRRRIDVAEDPGWREQSFAGRAQDAFPFSTVCFANTAAVPAIWAIQTRENASPRIPEKTCYTENSSKLIRTPSVVSFSRLADLLRKNLNEYFF